MNIHNVLQKLEFYRSRCLEFKSARASAKQRLPSGRCDAAGFKGQDTGKDKNQLLEYVVYKLIVFVLLTNFCFASELVTKTLPGLKTEEIQLENGMRVFLKPFDNGEKTISLEFIAPLGYESVQEDSQTPYRIAADVVFGSGVGKWNADKLTEHLYTISSEFSYNILSYYHYMSAETDQENLDALLKLIVDFFEKPLFYEKALQDVIQNLKSDSLQKNKDPDLLIERAYYALNGLKTNYYLPIPLKNLDTVTLDQVKIAFKTFFEDPAPFTCVIAGDFKNNEVKASLLKTLGSLKKKEKKLPALVSQEISFPKNNQVEIIALQKTDEELNRLTFPLPLAIQEDSFYKIDLLTQALESSLREFLVNLLHDSAAIDVSFELPLYPLKESPWLMVQYRTKTKETKRVTEAIITHLQEIKKIGFSNKITKIAEDNIKTSDESWQNENEYWTNFISNAALLNFEPEALWKSRIDSYTLTNDALNALLEKITFTHYTHLILNTEP